MGRNSPAEQVWRTDVAVPGGGNTLYLNDEEADRYNADPDAYAASHFGLSKIEYLQWIDLEGAPLCGHRTKGGDLCRNIDRRLSIASEQMEGPAPQIVLYVARRRAGRKVMP